MISKVQSTSGTHPLLYLQKFGFRASHEGMLFESLAPIDEISIVRACISSYFGVPLDWCLVMSSEFEETFSFFCLNRCSKYPSLSFFMMPVFLNYPVFPFVLMPPSCPFHRLCV